MSGISKLYINQKLAIHRFENGNDDPQKRDLSDVSSPYIWVDATYVKCRDGGHVSSCALVAAIGAASDGCRRLLGLDAVDAESYAGRLAFLRSLRERSVGGVLCVTSDAHEGLRRTIGEVLPGAAWQRRVVHPCATPPPARPRARKGAPCWRSRTPSSTSATRNPFGSCTALPAGR